MLDLLAGEQPFVSTATLVLAVVTAATVIACGAFWTEDRNHVPADPRLIDPIRAAGSNPNPKPGPAAGLIPHDSSGIASMFTRRCIGILPAFHRFSPTLPWAKMTSDHCIPQDA
jgi:hypothetical protein